MKAMKRKKNTAIFLMLCLFASVFWGNSEVAKAATSRSWSVYAQPGNYRESHVVSIVNHGSGYVAACTNKSGTAAAKKTTIKEYRNKTCTNLVAIDKKVIFTEKSTIKFKHKSMPSVDTVYMKAVLTYSNGATASMSGTVKISS